MRHSALFWRIASCIFASILLIEGVLLVYSWITERNRMISRVGDSTQLLVSSLDVANPVPQLDRLIDSPAANSEFNVLAFSHLSSEGTLTKTGHLPDSLISRLEPGQNFFDNSTNTIVTRHERVLNDGKTDSLAMRIDAGWIVSYMDSYVWRILGMVMVISLFVTVACLVFLKPLLIDPLRRLERLLTFKQSTGINESLVQQRDAQRRDELGAVFRSFTELRLKVSEAESRLAHLANHDDLTGLANRRHLSDYLDSCVESYRDDQKTCSLIILDLDHFKSVNDTAGHSAGDSLLVSIASVLRESIDIDSLIARQGGDEFAVVLPEANLEAATAIAEKIRQSVEEANFVWEQQQFSVSASIGIAEFSPVLSSKEALIMAADSGCIEAKKRGKNKIVTHESLVNGQIADEALWINRIIHALDTDTFTLFRQAIVRINSAAPGEHFEILLRMQNPEGGFYSPADFLPVAERNDLMPKIDRWVVDHAIAWLAQQDIDGIDDYCMNINISAISLASGDFRDYLQTKVESTRGINQYICFEVTETAAMSNYDQTVALLKSLKETGCVVALDDFGTGFSSLSHIRELPLDYIKIDGCFIQQISDNELDQTVVKSVAEIAKVLRIKTVAEFVDNEAALHMLEHLEIDYAQGFLFSRPQALESQSDNEDLDRAA